MSAIAIFLGKEITSTVITVTWLFTNPGIVSTWDNYVARIYLKEVVDKFGPAYPAKYWRKLKEELRMKQIAVFKVTL